MSTAALFGLILAGGTSKRMQRDKAALAYHGQPQLRWAFELLAPFCAATFVSVRPDQRDDATRAPYPQIVDLQPGSGPIAGIAAALATHPHAAWLVLACDLPFLTAAALQNLIVERDPQRLATAYRSAHDGLPEPLCAIWEPAARASLLAYLESGRQCPRRFLRNAAVKLLDLPDRRVLDNINTPEEFATAASTLGSVSVDTHGASRTSPPSMRMPVSATNPRHTERGAASARDSSSKTLRIQYYAVLREQAGRSEETLDTKAATPAELYDELKARYPFHLQAEQLKVALNSEFGEWQQPLKHGDTVVFIPPVAGG